MDPQISPNQADIEFGVLGPFHLKVNGEFVELDGRKPQILLAALLVNAGKVVPTDLLMDALWDSTPPPSARNLVQVYVSAIRKAIAAGASSGSGHATIVTRHPGYLLAIEERQLDSKRFESGVNEARRALAEGQVRRGVDRFRKALGLWRGAAFVDFAYASFVQAEAARLESMRLHSIEDRIDAELSLGLHNDVLAELEGLVVRHPLRERLRAQLMLALYRCGRQADALGVYREGTRILAESLGVAPSSELEELEMAIILRDRSLDVAHDSINARDRERYVLASHLNDGASTPNSVVEQRTNANLGLPDEAPHPGNLPRPSTKFIGRENELDEIRHALGASQLVTLTGTAGSGKTRLAIQAGNELLRRYPDGVWFFDLSRLSDKDEVADEIARTLGIRQHSNRPVAETLLHYLEGRTILLILDNCEHLLEQCRSVITMVTDAAPNTRVLTTSRKGLDVEGEAVVEVSPFETPSLQDARNPSQLKDWKVVKLLVNRANEVNPDLALDRQNAGAIATICQRLDGIPLAIELAAARLDVLTPHQLSEYLTDRLDVLVAQSTQRTERHQTLRAALDWSYDLLTAEDRSVLRALSVFGGDAAPESLEHVCGQLGLSRPQVLDALRHLGASSLVRGFSDGSSMRYRVLETIREYSRELLPPNEARLLADAHLEWFLRLAEEAESHFRDPDQAMWLDRLEREHDNLRAALRWAQSERRAADLIQMAGALWFFWYVRGYLSEGYGWLQEVVSRPNAKSSYLNRALHGTAVLALNLGFNQEAEQLCREVLALCKEDSRPEDEALALNILGLIARYEADYDQANALHYRALAVATTCDSKLQIGVSLNFLGLVAWYEDDPKKALELIEESSKIFRDLGDLWTYSLSLTFLGHAAAAEERFGTAIALFQEGLSISHRLRNPSITTVCLEGLAKIADVSGESDKAPRLLSESMRLHETLGELWRMAECLEQSAEVSASRDLNDIAARLLGFAETLRERAGTPRSPLDEVRYERVATALSDSMGIELFDEAMAEGRRLRQSEAVRISVAAMDSLSKA